MAMSILASLPQTSTTQNEPAWMAIDTAGQKLYVSYNYNPPPTNTNRVDKYDLATFTLETTMSTAGYRQAYPLSYDPVNNKLYTVVLKMSDFHAYVWKIDCATMTFTEFDLSVGVQTFLFPPNDSPVLAYDVDNQAAIYDTSAARYYMFLAGSSSSPADVCRVVVFNPASMSITGMAVIGTPLIPAGTGVYPRGVDIDYVNNKVWLGAYHITGEVSRYSLPSFALDGGFTAGEQINSVLVDPTNGFGYATDDPYAPPPTVAITIYKFDLSTMSLVDSLAEPFTAPFSLNLYIQSALGAGDSSGFAFFPISPDWTSLADQPRIQKIDLATFTESDVLLLGSPHAPNTDDLYTPYIVLDTANNVGYVAAGSMDGNLTPDLYKIGLGEPPPPEPGFGYGHNFPFHAYHDTGPTNSSIPHDLPLNQWTTTKGIGFRRSSILAAAALAEPVSPPICTVPYRTIIVQDGVFPSNTFATVNVPRGIASATVYAYGRGGGGSESGEGGGCGGFAASTMTLDPVFPGTIPVNITDSGTDAGTAFASAGGTPLGGSGTGDYTSNGGNGGDRIQVDELFYSGGDGCGGAAGGVWDGDTTGQDGVGIGAGGGGAGGNYEVPGVGGIGGPGLGIVNLCAGLGWRQRIHRRHDTGQTNDSISHETPLNQYTTTTGIGMRRKWFLGVEPPPPTPQPSPSPQPCSDPENFDLIFDSNRIYNQDTFVYGNNFTWVAPYGVYEVILQIQGNGTGGAQGGDDFGGCGGNGGECSYYVVSVIPGQSYPIVIDGTGIDWNSGEIFIAGDTSPQPGPTCDLSPQGTDGGEPECPGAGGSGGQGGQDYGEPGLDGSLGGGGGGGGAGAVGGYGGEGWVRVFYVKQFGVNNLINQSLYPSSTHQTHQTGQTNFSIPHCVPLNRQTTTKGIGVRRKWIVAAGLPVIIPPAAICNSFVSETFNETTTEWTAPPGVYVITVECQGAGGNGDNGATSIVDGWPGGGGGGSGGYAKSTVAVTPGVTYNISIGGTGSEGDTNFGSGMVVGNGGFGTIGGGGFGQIVFSGSNGFPGVGWVPPLTFSTGGNGADSPTGGFGGNGGQGDNSVGAGGATGGLGAGGGGGGGGADVGGPGGLGGAGWMTLTLPSGFGINHTFHQSHSTGQTNIAISHNCALSEWTTTKGIGMRRKWFMAFSPPAPPPVPFTAPLYKKYVMYAATATDPTPVVVPTLNCCANSI